MVSTCQGKTGAGRYLFGFNGKWNDNEVKGLGNQQNYGMRVYDPRIARFLSVDPLTKDYPWYTPYQYAGNAPIQAKDLDGEEEYHYTLTYNQNREPVLTYNKTVTEGWSIFGTYKIPEVSYIIHYNGETFDFSPNAEARINGYRGSYHLDEETFSSFLVDPESFESQDWRKEMILRATSGLVADATGKITGNISLNSGRSVATNRSRWPEGETGEQATMAHNGNPTSEENNAAVTQKVDLEARAKELHSKLPAFAQRKTTTAVGTGRTEAGKSVTLFASSDAHVAPVQRAALNTNEILIKNKNLGLKSNARVHAEAKIALFANMHNIKLEAVAPSRPACPSCVISVEGAGAKIEGAIKKVNAE